jgi:hypothetical protein
MVWAFWGSRKKVVHSEALAWEDFIRRDADALGDSGMSFDSEFDV